MTNGKITGIIFGAWIGVLLSVSVVLELYLQGQIYSYRTLMIVLILSVTGIFSSAFSWWLFSKSGRSTYATSFILCLANIILFFIIGILVSYVALEALPEAFKATQEPGHSNIRMKLTEFILDALATGFAFKTFGLPLLWPFGVISGFTGTFIFVHINKIMNSTTRH